MQLLEFEGKALFRKWGIPVPQGAIWPDLPVVHKRPLVVKAQIYEGGRGKRGGIHFVDDLSQVPATVDDLLGRQIGRQRVERVYVEERLEIAKEIYLAVVMDRDQRAPLILVSPHGGVDVEDRAVETVVHQRIDPLLGLRPSVIPFLIRAMDGEGEGAAQIGRVIESLYRAFLEEDALLLEINPLVVTTSGDVIAADSRVILDDAARFRHPDWPVGGASGTEFERHVAQLGAVGVEIDGDIAVVTSGAGLMMATVDSIRSMGGTIRAAVDLGSVVFGEIRVMSQVVQEVQRLQPKLILVNALFQLASCRRLAEGLLLGTIEGSWSGVMVVRLAGREVDSARTILSPVPVLENFEEACRLAISMTKREER